MPRLPRLHRDDAVRHIIDRGVNRTPIFFDDQDRRVFLRLLQEGFAIGGVSLLSYCLMGNHFHLLAILGSVPIGIPMQWVLTRYAHYFNRRHDRRGHLFQDRFKDIDVLDLAYLIHLSAYIHLNPVRAGLAGKPENWFWSSHHELVSGPARLIDLSRLHDVTGLDPQELRERYLERIEVLSDPNGRTLEEIVRDAARMSGLPVKDPGISGRGEAQSFARRIAVRDGIRAGYSKSELAEALGCSQPSVSEIARKIQET